MDWLLEPATLTRLREAVKAGAKIPDVQAAVSQRVMSVAGSNAQINVVGVLTNRRDMMAEYFGGGNTVYRDIRAALAEALANPSVQSIDMYIDSPGGQASAEWVETMDYVALCGKRKPVRAMVGGMAASAAYGIASQCSEIVAVNRMAMVGSIGVVATYETPEGEVSVTSTDAPDKNPDPSTEEGKTSIRTRLDAMHRVFVDTVAKGRKTDSDTVNTKYGRGAVLLAADALKAGMIDSIGNKNKKKETAMTLEDLKAQEPALYAQVVGLGVAKEQERVKAHVALGEACGDTALAMKHIADGTEPTNAVQALYTAAAIKATALKAKNDADAQTAAALDGAQAAAPAATDPVAAEILARLKEEGL